MPKCKLAEQGYEADTDDTLMQKSVKEMAKYFSSDYESDGGIGSKKTSNNDTITNAFVQQQVKPLNPAPPIFKPTVFVPGKKSIDDINWSNLETTEPIPSVWKPPTVKN